eukprot:38730_1
MDTDNKETIEKLEPFNVRANVTVTRAYQLPMAKLTVSGTLDESVMDSKENTVIRRAIIFVIDRSYSMVGERIAMVKNALTPFIQDMCNDENTIIKLVLFNNTVQTIQVPSLKSAIHGTIEKQVYASSGTNFYEASKGLVNEASSILKQYPTYQLTVIMCSDGEVSKDNAKQGHSHWKQFVNESYLKVHKTVPYVETIGISTAHDADVLDGFIVDDAVGNYCKCSQAQQIKEAFQRAQDNTMSRSTAIKLSIEFPLNVSDHTYSNNKQTHFHLHDLIVTSQRFSSNFWIAMDTLDHTTKGGGDALQLLVNGKAIPIVINHVTNNEQCQHEAIDYYSAVLRDMLHTLRNITDAHQLKMKAQEIEKELNHKYAQILKSVTAKPADKIKLQNQIKQLLSVDPHHTCDGDENTISKRRAQLMKQYKKMNKSWRKYNAICGAFQNTLASVKSLVREIILGQVRMQEIRQHILDLHFRKKHAKRMEKLILTDEQLTKRQEMYDNIAIPTEMECEDITDEIGTGCYLSTCSFREIAVEGDSLWMTGRVHRSGGVAVSNPELVQIDYISSDLASDSYFRMALEAANNDNDEKQMDNIGFADSSRQLINARIFPIYGNEAHFRASVPYIKEILSHTLSGRSDIHVVDYNALWTCLGFMICDNPFTTKNVKRILFEMKPSLHMLTNHIKCKPFKPNSYAREPDTNATYFITLAEKKRTRICKFIETFGARTTAWVSEVATLFADRLMNLDCVFDDEFYLSAIMHRLRIMFNLQAPKHMEEMRKIKVNENHNKLLQILICGDGHDDEKEQTTIEGDDASIQFNPHVFTSKILKQKKLFAVPQTLKPMVDFTKKDAEIVDEWNAKEIKPSTKQLLVDILSRMDVRGLIKGHSFFETLSNMKIPNDKENMNGFCKEFMKECKYKDIAQIPNDLNVLFDEIGWKMNVNVLRAMCCISILCHKNKSWHQNVGWFGDDVKKQIMADPESVLAHVYQLVIRNMRYEYKMYIERKNQQQLRAIHTNPILPDDVDRNGDLPYLRCGWKKCGETFENRDQLLNHVRFALYGDKRPLLHGFHMHCQDVIRNNPTISLSNFKKRVRNSFQNTKYAQFMKLSMYDGKMEYYYKHCRKGMHMTASHSTQPDIISYGNMYYFDELCSIRKR